MDKDETGGPKGKSTLVSRVGHEYVKSVHSAFLILHLMSFCSKMQKAECLFYGNLHTFLYYISLKFNRDVLLVDAVT